MLSVITSASHTLTVGFEHSRVTANEITTFMKTYTLQATDDTTGETVSYSFSITLYFTEFGKVEYYDHASRYPSHDELLRLYDEWGNMRSYSKWVSHTTHGAYYWTNEVSILFRAKLVDVTNGKIGSTGITVIGGQCAYAGKSKQ